MRTALLTLILLHGLIHVLGFSVAFNLPSVNLLTQEISKTNGVLWLLTAIVFIVTAILYFVKNDSWWIAGLVSLIVSQYLIITSWQDAKFGTIVNSIILITIILGYGTWHFRREYIIKVKEALTTAISEKESILTLADIQHLPEPLKRYLIYVGVLNKLKPKNFRVTFEGHFRQNEKSDWMNFNSEQFNFIDKPTRLFFMNAVMKKLPVAGFHCYKDGIAFMDIRLLSLIKVDYQSGSEMNESETVTFFNDMCVMAPASLIDKRIRWDRVEGNKVKAVFTNNSISISAWLHFNDRGELVNFVSDDRYALREDHTLQKARWSTPLKDYQEINGYKLASYGETIYSFPEGDFCYGKFRLKDVDYNCTETETLHHHVVGFYKNHSLK